MTSKERTARTLAFQQPDRVPIYDQFWFETQVEFRKAIGREFPDGITWATAHPWSHVNGTLWEYFDMDLLQIGWPDYCLRFMEPEVLQETDEWILQRDGNWAELRWWKHKMGTPEHVRFGIDTPERWAEVKPLLQPTPDRVRWDEFWPVYKRARAADRYLCYGTVEPFEMVKDVLGHEIMLMAMIAQPDWLHDVFETYTNVAIELFKITEAQGMECDGAFVYGDVAYKNAPFMSPTHYREFLKPYHKRLFDEFNQRGMPILYHSDGDIRMLLDDLISAGVTAINPLENNAGMDVRELAPLYGDRLGFCGNINVNVMLTNDRDAVLNEVRAKMKAAMPYNGYIYHSDHSIPPGVTLETYNLVLDEVRRIGKYE